MTWGKERREERTPSGSLGVKGRRDGGRQGGDQEEGRSFSLVSVLVVDRF